MGSAVDIVAILRDGSTPAAGTDALLQQAVPLQLAQGEDFVVRCRILNTAAAYVSLTGCTCVLSVAQAPINANQQGPAPVFFRAGAVQSPAADGLVYFPIIPADTLQLNPAENYYYDIWVIFPDTSRARVMPLSRFVVDGAIDIPGAPLTTATALSAVTYQNGTVTFLISDTSKTVTLATPYANTGYTLTLGNNGNVHIDYTKISGSQFTLTPTSPFAGEVSWHTDA